MSLLGALGGLVGFAMGGPAGAALGSGIGSLASGGDIGDALKSGMLGFVGGGAMAGMGAAGGQGIGSLLTSMGLGGQAATTMNPLARIGSAMTGGNAAAGGAAMNQMSNMARAGSAMGSAGGGGLTNLFNLGPQGGSILSNPMIQQANDVRRRNFAMGGYVEGPGTGTSDSIPAQIYQNGMPVQEAALSDGEFVLRERDVNAIGGGDPGVGAARLYAMQRQFDQGGMA